MRVPGRISGCAAIHAAAAFCCASEALETCEAVRTKV
jgi:hypothetical protein